MLLVNLVLHIGLANFNEKKNNNLMQSELHKPGAFMINHSEEIFADAVLEER